MPYNMTESNGGFKVTSPHGVKAKNTTKEKALRQMNLLRAIEHGWKPTGGKARDIKKKALRRMLRK